MSLRPAPGPSPAPAGPMIRSMHRVQLSLISLASYGKQTEAERRRPGRIACERLRCGSGRVVDISKTGAKLQIHSLFAPKKGESRTLTFQTAMGESATYPCVLMWVKKTGFAGYEVGAQFVGLSELQERQLFEIAKVHSKRTTLKDVA